MASNARDKAERCFALARSTSFSGERDNAIAQGTRIAEGAGLSLDLFDIPGRERKAAPKSEATFSGFWHEPPNHFSAGRRSSYSEQAARDSAFRDSWDYMAEELKRRADALRELQAREIKKRASVIRAINYLREQGAEVLVSRLSPDHWTVKVGDMTIPPMTSADLLKLADDVRAASAKCEEKRQYEAGRQPERCARCGSLITVGVRHECPSFDMSDTGRNKCRGGCGKTILFGDSCVDCDRRGFS